MKQTTGTMMFSTQQKLLGREEQLTKTFHGYFLGLQNSEHLTGSVDVHLLQGTTMERDLMSKEHWGSISLILIIGSVVRQTQGLCSLHPQNSAACSQALLDVFPYRAHNEMCAMPIEGKYR